jgi:hypothetical protein
MPDNVQLSQGALTVATVQDDKGVQHQEVLHEFQGPAGQPINVAAGNPLPTVDPNQIDLLRAILAEIRVQNELIYALSWPETEAIESLREKYLNQYPILP